MIRLIPFLVLTHTWWLAECIVLPSKPKSLVSAIYKSYMEDAILFLQSTKKTDSFRYAIIEKLDPMKSGEGVVPLMLVSILSSGGTDAETTLKPALLQVGAEVTGCSKYTCSCWMPLSQVPIYENLPQVQAVTPVFLYRNQAVPGTTKSNRNRSLQAGSVINEALQAMMVDKIRSQLDSSINGQGISIGVLSTSFDRDKFAVTHYDDDIQTNDLPNDVRVLEDGVLADQDQGRAMLQLIHDLAPNAKLLFHASGLGAENFSSGINKLADAGADVIVDDAIFFEQPFFQDGIIAQTANDVARLRGIPYFSAAGNYGRASYESPFVDSGEVATFPDGSECKNHKFGTDGNNQPIDFLRVTLDLGTLMVLQWDEPFASATSQPNVNGDAVEILELPSGTLDPYICLYDGSPPGLFKFIEFGEAIVAVSPSVALDKSTSFGHRNTKLTAGVGAANFLKTPANGVTPPVLA